MGAVQAVYWLAVAGLVYPYLVYPAVLAVLGRLGGRPVRRVEGGGPGSVSVVIAACDEAAAIGRRVGEFTDRIVAEGLEGEVLIVSDGSTDATAAVARSAARDGVPVQVVELPRNQGKAAALSAGCAVARHEVLVLADARQSWAPDALRRLLENFADPEVGAVSGRLVVEAAPGVMAGVGLYWRLESWMRRQEGRIHSTVGLTGAVAAVRRALFRPVPPGTLLDDVYWPLQVVMQGYRVVLDERAVAFDRLPDRVGAEFRRKVRTLGGNFQLLTLLPAALLPWRNPVWFAFVSHKLARLAVPWATLAALGLSAWLGGPLYGSLCALQTAALLVGLAGLSPRVAARSRLAAAGAAFLVLNAAAAAGLWVWATGRAASAWNRTEYQPGPSSAPLEEANR